MHVGLHRGIHLIEMSPITQTNLAYGRFDSGIIVSQAVTVACTMVGLCQDKPCGHEQIVLW